MTDEERAICTAPTGQLRLVHIDPRDHCPTAQGDFGSQDEVDRQLGSMMHAQRITMTVYDDQGQPV